MKKDGLRISDTELEIMNILWRSGEPLSSAEVFDRLETGWKYPTVTTLLGRLADKGAVSHEKRGKAYYYSRQSMKQPTKPRKLSGLLRNCTAARCAAW